MKRLWIGILLLALLLVGTLLAGQAMEQICQPVTRTLQLAQRAIAAQQLNRAAALVQQAGHQWLSGWKTAAIFSDQAPLEQADGLFLQLEGFLSRDEPGEAAAACGLLIRQLQAIAQAQQLRIWSIM